MPAAWTPTDIEITWSEEKDKSVSADPNSTQDLETILNNLSIDWLNDTWFYLNILNYFLYCTFLVNYRFVGEDYGTIISTCMQGTYYELQMAAEMYPA